MATFSDAATTRHGPGRSRGTTAMSGEPPTRFRPAGGRATKGALLARGGVPAIAFVTAVIIRARASRGVGDGRQEAFFQAGTPLLPGAVE